MSDNWPTGGATHICRFCTFYNPKLSGIVGRCRRHAPTMSGFPIVFPTDTCGEHRLDGERLPVLIEKPLHVPQAATAKGTKR